MAEWTFQSKKAKQWIDAISDKLKNPMTRMELQTVLGVSSGTCKNYLKYMKQNRMVFISGWAREREGEKVHARPIYSAGEGQDAPKIKAFSERMLYRRRVKKLKENPLLLAAYEKRRAHHHWKKKFKPHCDIAASWIKPK